MLQNGLVAIDMFLRVLNALHEEVVSSDTGGYDSAVASRVKDGMREGCLPTVADAWHSILQLHHTARAAGSVKDNSSPKHKEALNLPL